MKVNFNFILTSEVINYPEFNFRNPVTLAVDEAGKIYITDTHWFGIRLRVTTGVQY